MPTLIPEPPGRATAVVELYLIARVNLQGDVILKTTLSLLASLFFFTGCKLLSERTSPVQVTNGTVAEVRVLSEGVVRLRSEFSKDGRGFRSTCTGTLVHTPDERLKSCVVLSAAHCFKDAPTDARHNVEFVSAQGKVTVSAVAKAIHVHPAFNASGSRVTSAMSAVDVSLVEFPCEAFAGTRAAKILDYKNAQVGANLIIAGYGLTTSQIQAQINKERGLEGASTEATTSDVLMQTEMRIRRVEFPAASTGQSKESEGGVFLLAGSGGRSSCNGDSGGPAFLDVGGRLYLVATTSAGPEQCERSTAVYTISSTHVAWMNQVLGSPVISFASKTEPSVSMNEPSAVPARVESPAVNTPMPTAGSQPAAGSGCSAVSLKVTATTRSWGTIVKLQDRDSTQIKDTSLKCNLKNESMVCVNENPRVTGTGNSTALLVDAIVAPGCEKFAKGQRVFLFGPDFIRAE